MWTHCHPKGMLPGIFSVSIFSYFLFKYHIKIPATWHLLACPVQTRQVLSGRNLGSPGRKYNMTQTRKRFHLIGRLCSARSGARTLGDT